MGMPATQSRRWTPEEVRRLTERSPSHWPRYELIDGELLVSPAPRVSHHLAFTRLLGTLLAYTDRERCGRAMASPADLQLEPDSIVQPDLFVLPPHDFARVRSWADFSNLLLAVEILSPSTAAHDRGFKRRYYQRTGVTEYWIVDLDARVVERWRPLDTRPEILAHELVWHPAGALAPLVIDLKELFLEAETAE